METGKQRCRQFGGEGTALVPLRLLTVLQRERTDPKVIVVSSLERANSASRRRDPHDLAAIDRDATPQPHHPPASRMHAAAKSGAATADYNRIFDGLF